MISRASVIFRGPPCSAGAAREWGLWLGTAPTNVSAWRYGDRTPNAAMRQRIRDEASKRYQVEIIEEWWDEKPTAEQLQPKSPQISTAGEVLAQGASVPRATADDTAAEADRLLAYMRTLRQELAEQGGAYDLSQRVSMSDKLAASIERLGKFTGIRLTERQILASPIWLELEERVMKALEPFPDAMRAVAATLSPATKDPKA